MVIGWSWTVFSQCSTMSTLIISYAFRYRYRYLFNDHSASDMMSRSSRSNTCKQTYYMSPKLPLKTKASAFCGAPTAMTPAAAATAPASMARARLSGAGTKAMLFRRQATAAKTHTAARRAMVRTGKGRDKAGGYVQAQSSLQLSKTAAGRKLINRSKLTHFDSVINHTVQTEKN